jgi:rubrerythrin
MEVRMAEVKLEEVIATAIKREETAYLFYEYLTSRVEDALAKETLVFLMGEEKKHKEFLENYLSGQYSGKALRMTDVVNYKLAEHLEKPDIEGKLETKEVYLIAAHRELNSYNFYSEMAAAQPEGETRSVFLRMANEELKHKEKMEYLYSNTAFPQLDGG